MTERVEEIRQAEEIVAAWESNPEWNRLADASGASDAGLFLARLSEQRKGLVTTIAAALAQAEREAEGYRENAAHVIGCLEAEVERLKDTARTFEARWMAAVNDLARVRAALDREHICVFEACCNDAVRAALEGR